MLKPKFYLKLLMSLLLMALAIPQAKAADVTICNGTTTNYYVPIDVYKINKTGTCGQMIIPSTTLGLNEGDVITAITFYGNQSVSNSANVTLRLGETTATTITSSTVTSNRESAQQVFTGTFPSSSGTDYAVTFNFTSNYTYQGGNLIVDLYRNSGGTSGSTSFKWYGVSASSGASYYVGSGSGQQAFLPKMEITYEASGGSVSVNPTSLNFNESNTYVDGSYQKTFTVNNTTEEAVNITMTGDNVFTFSPSTVAAGSTETITVTYAPTAVGTNNATLTVGGKTVTLAGTAVAAPAPTIMVNPTSLSINTDPGTAASDKFTVTGTNLTNDINLTVSGSGFSVIPNTITKDNAANGVDVTVTYTPNNSEGTFEGTITLSSEGAESKTVNVTAIASWPVISGTVTPTTLNLTCQEGASTTGTITIENTGNTAFTPVFSTLEAPFSIEAATEIAAGASKQFTVTYAPATAGNHNATLTVTINNTSTAVTLNGTATEAPEGGELTVADNGVSTVSSIAPIYGGKYTQTGWVQMLYPASMLSELTNKQITQITFYNKNTNINYCQNGVVEVLIGETSAENEYLGSSVSEATLKNSTILNGVLSAYNSTTQLLTITLSTPYVYNGGSLIVETKVTTAGTDGGRTEFYGQQYTNDMVATSYSITGTHNYYRKNILPKATFTYEKVAGVIVEPADGALAFGEVSTTGSKTLYVTVDNKNSVAVPVSVSTPEAPFSCSYTDTEIPANSTVQIPVRFAPREGINYNGTFIVTVNNVEYTFTLTGTGHVNEPTMGEDDFADLTYDWTDSEGNVHEDTPMNEPATTAEQMIALMKAVYTNPAVPGNIYRGYTAAGEKETDLVSYPAIGTVSNYEYSDSYGWNIPAVNDLYRQGSSSYLNPTDYLPNKEGLTVLLVEMNDQAVAEAKATKYGLPTTISGNTTYQSTSSYADLVKKFDVMFKSVRVLTSSKNIGAGETGGTLFKIDCDKMNRFFLLGKGRLRTYYSDNVKMSDANGNSYQVMTSTDVNKGPFYQMFEQFSPNVATSGTSAETDIYQKLVNMEAYGVLHDCVSVPTIDGHHEFNLYGVESVSDDCQDVRDMMLFIPERRMTWWDASSSSQLAPGYNKRDNSDIDHYVNYYRENAPKLGLFVIHQNEITGEQIDGQDTYRLHLTWTSNLLDFLPGEDGQYTLYRVVTNEDGTKTYTPVVENLDPNTFEYYDNVPMQHNGQQVTYVVRGQDKEQFLTLQLSNEESFVIPGLDRAEQLRIELNSDYYYSRYDAATKTNNYSNSLIANNTVGTNVKANYLRVWQEGSDVGMFKFWRATLKTVDGQEVVDKENAVNFANCKVTAFDATTGGTLAYEAGDNQTDFSGKPYGAGYHANAATSTISIDENDNVVFDGLKLYDNFSVSVEDNTHPSVYVYYVTLQTAVPFNLNDEGTERSDMATSNTVSVPVYKTEMAMNPLTAQDVEDDVTHQIPASTDFNLQARYSGKSEILAYYIYRWADKKTAAEQRSIYEDDGADASPQGQAGNQGEYYTVAMNADYTDRTENFTMDAEGNHNDVTALFKDNFMVKEAQNSDTYTYAPVVELFAPAAAVNPTDNTDRKDYNTYGGPQQMTAGGVLKANVESMRSEYTWTANGKTYAYYNVFLDVNTLDLPEGYEVAKVRAWRKIAPQYLGEQEPGGKVPDYTHRLNLDVNGEYKFVDKEACQQGEALGNELVGSAGQHIYSGTFGALKLEAGEEIPMDFVVRVYFTKSASQGQGAPMLKAESNQPYYIAEYTVSDKLTSNVVTGIIGIDGAAHITGVKYYNAQGMESATPFQGVNIEVITYDDGTRSTRKVLR